MQIIQKKKGNMKICLVINIYEKLNLWNNGLVVKVLDS